MAINRSARAVLEQAPRGESPWVLPSPYDPEKSYKHGLPIAWSKIRKAAAITHHKLHNLRHTVGTFGAELDSLYRTGKVLGQRQSSTTERYAHVSRGDIAELSERISSKIDRELQRGAMRVAE